MRATATSIFLLLLFAGCVIVPSRSKDPIVGNVIALPDTEFIVVGVTTRDEVIQRLGSEFRELWRRTALAYSWELPGGSIGIAVFSMGGAFAEDFEWSRWRAFFVAFNENGIVTKKKFIKLSANKSLDQQLESWANRPIAK